MDQETRLALVINILVTVYGKTIGGQLIYLLPTRPLLLEAAGHRENFPSCLHFHLESQKIGTQNGSALNNHGAYKNVR